MMLKIPGVLTGDTLQTVRHLLAEAPFVDGRLTAGMAAERVKHNLELERKAEHRDLLNKVCMTALDSHPVYKHGALPFRASTPIFARYTPGMTYGDHVDDPIMGSGTLYRSDVAVTLFLSDPEDYDGGELVVRTPFGDNRVKLPAGDAVVYPALSVHSVAPLTRGTRTVMITWVQSMVRDPGRRELLYELHLARETLLREQAEAEHTKHVDRAYVNLIRMWSEI
jgi:PKHD-type hydroxylase